MEAASPRDIGDFSLMDHATQSDPHEFHAVLRQKCPVYRMPETGMFIVTRYVDVLRVLRDTETFSNNLPRARGGGMGEMMDRYARAIAERGWAHVPTLQMTDPPEHTRYRQLLDKVFTVGRVREMQPHIEQVAHELIDEWIDDGECEFNRQFAMPLPGIILAEELGLEGGDIATFKRWADALIAVVKTHWTEEEFRANVETELEMQHFLARAIEDRRRTPRNDIISGLAHACGDDGAPLTMFELQSIMSQLIGGGFESTQSALGHAMWRLLRNPDLEERLRADPKAIKAFCEESLRIESPVVSLARLTTRDVDLHGTPIPEGSVVLVRYASANRDPAKFERPDSFSLDRKNVSTHLAFGTAPHFCVGAVLARQEIMSSFTVLLDRLDRLELARPLPDPVHQPSLNFMPLREMPVRFRKRR